MGARDVALERVGQRPPRARHGVPQPRPFQREQAERLDGDESAGPGMAGDVAQQATQLAGRQVRCQTEAGHVQIEGGVAHRSEAVAEVVEHVLAGKHEVGRAEVDPDVGAESRGVDQRSETPATAEVDQAMILAEGREGADVVGEPRGLQLVTHAIGPGGEIRPR